MRERRKGDGEWIMCEKVRNSVKKVREKERGGKIKSEK